MGKHLIAIVLYNVYVSVKPDLKLTRTPVFYSSDTVNHDSVTVNQYVLYQHPETEAAKLIK